VPPSLLPSGAWSRTHVRRRLACSPRRTSADGIAPADQWRARGVRVDPLSGGRRQPIADDLVRRPWWTEHAHCTARRRRSNCSAWLVRRYYEARASKQAAAWQLQLLQHTAWLFYNLQSFSPTRVQLLICRSMRCGQFLFRHIALAIRINCIFSHTANPNRSAYVIPNTANVLISLLFAGVVAVGIAHKHCR